MHWHEEHEKPIQRSMSHDGQCRGEVENQHFDCSGYGKSSSTFHCMVIRIGFKRKYVRERRGREAQNQIFSRTIFPGK